MSCEGFTPVYDSDAVFNATGASSSTSNEASALVLDDGTLVLEEALESHAGDSLVEPVIVEPVVVEPVVVEDNENTWGAGWNPQQLKAKPTSCLRTNKRKGKLSHW